MNISLTPPPRLLADSLLTGLRSVSSQSANLLHLITITLSLTLLVACGGGGSGGTAAVAPTTTMTPPTTDDPMTPPTTTPTVMLEPLPAYVITDIAAARTRVGGTAPTNMTETEIITAVQERATVADTLRIGDTVQRGRAGFQTDIKSSCSGKSCTANVPSIGTLTFSLTGIEDLSLIDGTANLVGFDSDTRVVMVDNGITSAESRSAARQEDGTKLTFQSYGGWLTGSAFGTGYLDVTEGATTTNRFTSFSFGKASGSNPMGTGKAEWTGSAVGIDTDNGQLWQADVTVDIDDLEDPNVDLSITGGRYTGRDNILALTWAWNDMPLTDGIFQLSNSDENVWGSFYGDNHGEVGGTFDDDNTVGAFGATRQ